MFSPVDSNPDFPSIEKEILEFWERHETFRKSLEQNSGNEEFIFYDGPPFATGLPHYGHLLAGTIKDVIPRYRTMKGSYVPRVFGWDCHGLPVEYEMEKELDLSGKQDIEEFGIGRFNEECRKIVLRYTGEWEQVVKRMGRWVDFESGYRTMDLEYMESIWWVFKSLWDKGLIYEGHKILPYCPRCSTPLSNFEANQGYSEVEDPAITIRFMDSEDSGIFYLAWTTTPWTLPSNMALAVGADIRYAKVNDGENIYIVAESLVSAYFREEDDFKVLETFAGKELAGKKYVPIFPYFESYAGKGAFRIICADFVSTDDGTGIVHIAPGFGEDDAEAGRANGLPEICPVDEECRFTSEIYDYEGCYVKDADKAIIRRLKEEKKLVYRSTVKHNYPHCWRDDTPLIYRAVSTWFVDIAPVKDSMIKANSSINWIPEHIKEGRFGNWLENARDWAISRNRYWGCPLPLWRNKDTGEILCVGSIAELEELSGSRISDIHKHFVDRLEIPSPSGGAPLKRVPEVLDCWFESGSMPYAQNHYPFENKKRFEKNFPADFIAEGLDQTRGWFYTLVVLGAALFDRPAFQNVVVNGLVLAEDGRKMSKREKNYPDPKLILEKYGADPLRLFMLSSQVVRAEDLRFSENAVKDVLRSVLLPVWNAFSFFTTYASVDKWEAPDPASPPEDPKNPLDRWILSSASGMVSEIDEQMDAYHLQKAANRFEEFVEDLTNWYIRRSRRRFWKSSSDRDKDDAYRTLHFCLLTFCRTAAPFIPFITEYIYRKLRTGSMPESVHLSLFPEMMKSMRDEELEKQMEHTIVAVSLGRHLRTQLQIKTRQPLSKVFIVSANPSILEMLAGTADIISEELNVKEVVFRSDEHELVTRTAKANFPRLGPRLGKDMREANAAIMRFDESEIQQLLDGNEIRLELCSEKEIRISAEDIVVRRQEKEGLTAATEKELTVALDTKIDEQLRREGLAREFVSRVQNMRKDIGLDVSDRIRIECVLPEKLQEAVKDFSDYVRNETLSVEINFCSGMNNPGEKVEINEFTGNIYLSKISGQ